ncbi:hypothetical protein ACWEFK_13735, partial [Streptomyces sp. NPDC004830]
GKAGAVAKALSVAGKAGRVIDPMTYIAKGAGAGLSKIGDITKGLRGVGAIDIPTLPENALTLPKGSTVLPDGTVHLPEGAAVPAGLHELPGGGFKVPDDVPVVHEDALPVKAEGGDPVLYADGNGNIVDGQGKVLLDVEKPGTQDVVDRPAGPESTGPAGADVPRVDSPAKVPAMAGAAPHTVDAGTHLNLGNSLDTNLGDVGRATDNPATTPAVHAGGDLPGGSVGDHLPGGTAGHTPGGRVGDHLPTNELDNGRHGGTDGTPGTGAGRPETPSTAGHTDGPGTSGTHGDGPATGTGGHHEPPAPGSGGLPGGADDLGRGADDLGRGADDLGRGADDLGAGADDAAQGADDVAGGADDATGGPAQHADDAARHRAEYEAAREKPADDRTPDERAAITREHVRLANEDPVWRAEHYDKWGPGKRNNAEEMVDGQLLPKLVEKPGGGWMAADAMPYANPERFHLTPLERGRDTVPPENLNHLDDVSARRIAGTDLTNAERAYKTDPSDETAKALLEAQERFNTVVGDGVSNNSKLGEALGEEAARRHMLAQKEFEGVREVTDLPDTPNGSKRFDQLWRDKDGNLIIVEAKAPNARLDWRQGNGLQDSGTMVKQGTIEYVRTILADMEERAIFSPNDAKYAAEIRTAIENKSLRYVLVQATENTGKYAGAELKHFKIF